MPAASPARAPMPAATDEEARAAFAALPLAAQEALILWIAVAVVAGPRRRSGATLRARRDFITDGDRRFYISDESFRGALLTAGFTPEQIQPSAGPHRTFFQVEHVSPATLGYLDALVAEAASDPGSPEVTRWGWR